MLAVAATMFFSCQKQQEVVEEIIPEVDEQIISFNALPLSETKTAFGAQVENDYPTLWTDNDKNVKISMNYKAPKDAAVAPSVDYRTATFTAAFEADGSDDYTFYALSPSSASVSVSSDYKSWNIGIPTSQTPITGSVDEGAQIIFAKSATMDAFPTESVDLHFSHLTAYACMSLANLDLDDAVISSISITAGSNIAGRWYYYPDTETFSESSASATITVNTNNATDVMFALAPVDLTGKSFKVVVNTDKGTFTKQTASWPSGHVFQAGHVAKFGLNMSGIVIEEPKVYELVTNVAQLSEGSKVIIAGAETNTAMSTTQNTNNRADAAVTKSNNKISSPGENVEIFTVEAGTKANTLSFLSNNDDDVAANNGYIYAASSGSNYLRTEGNKSDNSSFTVTIDGSGVATVVAQGTNTRNHLRHNSGLFSCYASTSSVSEKVSFYKLQGSGAPVVINPAINVTSDNPLAIANTAGSYTIEYSIDNATEASLTAALKESAAWISNIDYSAAGEVTFDVAAQVANAPARSAVIVLSYTGADDVEVTVNQAAGAGASSTVTYTVTSKTVVSTTGSAPAGSSATYSQTGNTASQMTNGNSITLTLSGYDGKTIKGASVSVKSNSSKGQGSLSLSTGSDSIASISDSKFNTAAWNGAWSTSYVSKTLSITERTIAKDATIVLTISATENSLYFESLTLTYE